MHPTERAKHFKALCSFLNADMVGIRDVPDYAWYSHDERGNEIASDQHYAIFPPAAKAPPSTRR